MNLIKALYGGTFDPVHNGHLKPIEILVNLIGLDSVIIIPNNLPPHRPKPEASNEQRKKMLELAISDRNLFKIDEREMHRNSFSYISQTLREWRNEQQFFRQPMAFIIGQDSLLTLPSWYQYESILNNSHLIVCQRPGYLFKMKNIQHQQWLEKHLTDNINDLYQLPFGKIYLAKTPQINISATLIRQRLQLGLNCEEMLPPNVLEYILEQNLYQKKN